MSNPFAKVPAAIRRLVNHFTPPPFPIWALLHRRRLRQFHDKHLGQGCFIIGNGPSLNMMDLKLLRNVCTFGLNKIYLHPEFASLDLDYHVSVNPLVIEQSIEEFRNMGCTSFLAFEPCYERNLVSRDFHYVMTGVPHRFSFRPYDRISEGCTVTYVAIQLAYFMGFSTVYLVGVDHSFQAQGNPHEKQVMKGPDLNHFHPDYFSGKEWQLPDLEGSELSFELARYYFERSGRKIYDATVQGKLNVFPKMDYEDAVRQCLSQQAGTKAS